MARKVVYDANDASQVSAAQKEADDRDADLNYLMKEPRGRRWVYQLIHHTCHINRLSHVPQDTHSTAFHEGGRSVGLAVMEELRTAQPDKFLLMLKENADE